MAEVVMFCVACTRGVRKNELKYADGRVFHAECYAKLGGNFVAPDASVAEQSAKLKMDLIELKNQLTILKRKSGSRPKARKKAATRKTKKVGRKKPKSAKKTGRKKPKGKAKKNAAKKPKKAAKAGRKRPKSAAKKTGRKKPKGKAKKNAAKKPKKAAKAGRKRPKSKPKSAKKAGRKRR